MMFEELLKNYYQVILADPPWPGHKKGWTARSGRGFTVEEHYPSMNREELLSLPIRNLATDNSLLFLWVRSPRLGLGLEVMKAWGFTYKTVVFVWVKLDPLAQTPFIGLGYWTQTSVELCLLGKRGNPKRKEAGMRQLITASRREHSRKPDEQYERIERMVEGPYLELFARQRRPGWDSWGLEVDKFKTGNVNQ